MRQFKRTIFALIGLILSGTLLVSASDWQNVEDTLKSKYPMQEVKIRLFIGSLKDFEKQIQEDLENVPSRIEPFLVSHGLMQSGAKNALYQKEVLNIKRHALSETLLFLRRQVYQPMNFIDEYTYSFLESFVRNKYA